MAESLPSPGNEFELLSRVPAINHPGLLPRELLPPGERIVFETRASLLSLYWGRLLFLTLYLAFFLGLGASASQALPGGILLSLPAFAWLFVLLLQWWNRVYALTDRRVIRISGARGTTFEDAAYAQITRLSTDSGTSGGLIFDTAPQYTSGQVPAATKHRRIQWEGLPQAPRVYAFVQEACAFYLRRDAQAAATQATYDRLTTGSIRCAYCGGWIDPAALDPKNPGCPRCSAPLRLPS